MVNIGRLFRKPEFQSLNAASKVVYLYLCAHPDISTVGMLTLNPSVVIAETGVKSIEELRTIVKDLKKINLIQVFESTPGLVMFMVTDHFDTLPKSEATVKKATKEVSLLNEKIVNVVLTNIDISKKFITFTAPTEQEVQDYALSEGYVIDPKEVIKYYTGMASKLGKQGWYDGRGKVVKDWKAKLKRVWFKDDRKLKETPGAPKGYEYFHVINEQGNLVYPDYWQDGKPYSREGLPRTITLQQAYEDTKRQRDSGSIS